MRSLPAGGEFKNWQASGWMTAAIERSGYEYRVGFISTPHGIVGFYDQGRKTGDSPHTRLEIVIRGRSRVAFWKRTFSDRYLKTVAKRFAARAAST